ncbi:MAG: hypothetical protein ACYTG2_07830 [Planctomycetota bacterium]
MRLAARRVLARAAPAAFLALVACTGPEETTTELHLPTEAEAQAAADARIDQQNAEAEFDALLEEIESDR